jgi:membrane-associated protein
VGQVQEALQLFAAFPSALLYLALAGGAAVENILPPVPADAFVIAGGLLAARGVVDAWMVFLVTWLANVGAAVGVYLLAKRHGGAFFKMPVARWLIREHQLEQVARFYGRWGVPAIFLGRFLPGWRAMVPVFAGIARARGSRVIPPLALASALWHALLVGLGVLAGRNLELITAFLSDLGRVLLILALAALGAFAAWWWRTRRQDHRT